MHAVNVTLEKGRKDKSLRVNLEPQEVTVKMREGAKLHREGLGIRTKTLFEELVSKLRADPDAATRSTLDSLLQEAEDLLKTELKGEKDAAQALLPTPKPRTLRTAESLQKLAHSLLSSRLALVTDAAAASLRNRIEGCIVLKNFRKRVATQDKTLLELAEHDAREQLKSKFRDAWSESLEEIRDMLEAKLGRRLATDIDVLIQGAFEVQGRDAEAEAEAEAPRLLAASTEILALALEDEGLLRRILGLQRERSQLVTEGKLERIEELDKDIARLKDARKGAPRAKDQRLDIEKYATAEVGKKSVRWDEVLHFDDDDPDDAARHAAWMRVPNRDVLQTLFIAKLEFEQSLAALREFRSRLADDLRTQSRAAWARKVACLVQDEDKALRKQREQVAEGIAVLDKKLATIEDEWMQVEGREASAAFASLQASYSLTVDLVRDQLYARHLSAATKLARKMKEEGAENK